MMNAAHEILVGYHRGQLCILPQAARRSLNCSTDVARRIIGSAPARSRFSAFTGVARAEWSEVEAWRCSAMACRRVRRHRDAFARRRCDRLAGQGFRGQAFAQRRSTILLMLLSCCCLKQA